MIVGVGPIKRFLTPPDPHKDGSKIPSDEYDDIIKQVHAYAAKQPWSADYTLQARFKGQFFYIDSIEKDNMICPLGRLRYFRPDRWSIAFFTYSNERYTPCCLSSGKEFRTFIEALQICEAYLV